MTKRSNRRRRGGFTLMEVLLVLVILVILGSVVAVSLSGARKRALVDSAKTQLSNFKSALTSYNIDVGSFPTQQQGGLAALRTQPPDVRKWRGPYSDAEVPEDPWGNAYGYESDGSTYRIWSNGPLADDPSDDVQLLGE